MWSRMVWWVALGAAVIAGSVWFVHRQRAATQPAYVDCPAILRSIDSAKQNWAVNHKAATANSIPTWDDIRPYLGRDWNFHCPQGGTYTLGSVREPPRCSYPGHAIQ